MNPFALLIILSSALVASALIFLANEAGISGLVALQLLIGLSALLVLFGLVWRLAKKVEDYAWLHENPSWVASLKSNDGDSTQVTLLVGDAPYRLRWLEKGEVVSKTFMDARALEVYLANRSSLRLGDFRPQAKSD